MSAGTLTTPAPGIPAALDSERVLLGYILRFPGAVTTVHEAGLRPGDCFRRDHQIVLQAAYQLADRGLDPDLPIILTTVQAATLDGGPAGLSALVDDAVKLHPPNVREHVRRVLAAASARRLIRALETARDTLSANPDALLNGFLPELSKRLSAEAGAFEQGAGLPSDALADAVDVAAEGQRIEAEGIPYLVPGLVPALGMLGFLVAFTKVGKTTFAQALAAAVAMYRRFLDRETVRARVLVIAAEDPPEYVAWLARYLDVEPGWITFYRGPILFDGPGLARITNTVKAGGYGLVLTSTWQAVTRGLVRDENDNANSVAVVEAVKAAARATGVPWLIDAHAGKGEDQADDADPSRAMRGASAAAGAADYTLSLRYANGAFGTQRKLSGRGRFVSFEPLLMDFDPATGQYTALGETKNALVESTWRLICETGALTMEPRSAGAIAVAAGLVDDTGKAARHGKRQVAAALVKRAGVLRSEEMLHGKSSWLYRLAPEAAS